MISQCDWVTLNPINLFFSDQWSDPKVCSFWGQPLAEHGGLLFLLHSSVMSLAEAGVFFSPSQCEKSSGRMLLLLGQLRLFPVTFQPEKIFTPENREDNFPSLTLFQWHLDCVKGSCVRWEQYENIKAEQCLLNRLQNPG